MDPGSALDFSKGGGLVSAVAVDHETGEVLMVASMNEEAFRRTLETRSVGEEVVDFYGAFAGIPMDHHPASGKACN